MDIFTPLYHEGVLFFLPGEYLSYVTDKIKGGGGGEILRYHSDFFSQIQIFFHIHSDLSLLESGRSVFSKMHLIVTLVVISKSLYGKAND